MIVTQPADVLALAANLLLEDKAQEASSVVLEEYPFTPHVKKRKVVLDRSKSANSVVAPEERKYTQKQSLVVFREDGYIDRYTGKKLVAPSVLYALANALPEAMPFLGKRADSHQAIWDLFPTIDHVNPVARGGEDVRDNWITTSMTLNMDKSNLSLEDLGWLVHPAGELDNWDGLVGWYINYAKLKPSVGDLEFNKGWHKAILSLNG